MRPYHFAAHPLAGLKAIHSATDISFKEPPRPPRTGYGEKPAMPTSICYNGFYRFANTRLPPKVYEKYEVLFVRTIGIFETHSQAAALLKCFTTANMYQGGTFFEKCTRRVGHPNSLPAVKDPD